MATVKSNVLGNFSGKLGNLVARTIYGKTVLAARPSGYNVSQDPDIVANRQKFAVTVNFSKYVSSIPILKSIWQKTKPQNISVFNSIVKTNYRFSTADRPTDQNILTPGGFSLPVSSAEIDAGIVTVLLGAFNDVVITESYEENVSFASIIVLYNPIAQEDAPFSLITSFQDVETYDFANPYTLTMKMHASEAAEAAKYNNNILLLAAATKDANSKIVQYSQTYSLTS